MRRYPAVALERAMKVQEVFMQAMAKKITWMQAAEIMGVTDRTMRRWKGRHEKHGFVLDQRYGRPSEKKALQASGLVAKTRDRRVHRKKRPRRPLPGMLLHIDGSHHQWFQDDRWFDLLVILDDATSEIYYAQLVEDESTRTVMAALRHVVETRGWFASIYSDRAGHFFLTP